MSDVVPNALHKLILLTHTQSYETGAVIVSIFFVVVVQEKLGKLRFGVR